MRHEEIPSILCQFDDLEKWISQIHTTARNSHIIKMVSSQPVFKLSRLVKALICGTTESLLSSPNSGLSIPGFRDFHKVTKEGCTFGKKHYFFLTEQRSSFFENLILKVLEKLTSPNWQQFPHLATCFGTVKNKSSFISITDVK